MSALYEALRADLTPDGALRDILVPDAGRAGWMRMLEALATSPYAHFFSIDGVLQDGPPSSLDDVEHIQQSRGVLLQLKANAEVALNCHFFGDAEIEFDADPCELLAEPNFDATVDLMKWLCRVTACRVVMAHEGVAESVFLLVEGGSAKAV